MMIGGSLLGASGCNPLIRDTYLAAMALLLGSFFLKREWRIPAERISVRWYALSVGAAGFACFFVAMAQDKPKKTASYAEELTDLLWRYLVVVGMLETVGACVATKDLRVVWETLEVIPLSARGHSVRRAVA